MDHSSKMPQALLMLSVLAAILIYALYPYINAFFGAFILYVIFKPLYIYMTNKKRVNKSIAAFAIIILTIVLILIPLYILMTIVFFQIQNVFFGTNTILESIGSANIYISHLHLEGLPVEINIREKIMEVVVAATDFLSTMLLNIIESLGQRIIEFVIMYFLLYYLFVGEGSKYSIKIRNAVPFSRKNTEALQNEFKTIVNATMISSGIIALVQGSILTLVFLLLGVDGAFLWGFVAVILSFVPFVGATVIWLPAVIIQLIQQDYFTALGILIGGIILSSIDNVLRPIIQKKIGSIHPLESLIGVIIGLKLFGLLGIIIGPLLISYVILMAKMFNEEYLLDYDNDNK
ncbi:AI-2E family transporter [Methanolobus psychrotolerans]|uniref:AI-2E family transporter n=1 Tax=Methanolobus psychrotolerans TaxID=1874706 RepID=UPI000B915A15|nr:AI-2E family transporter [Methanolobus psychrotolerans]